MRTELTVDIRTAWEMILFRFSLSIYMYVSFNTVSNSCILPTLFHDCTDQMFPPCSPVSDQSISSSIAQVNHSRLYNITVYAR